MGPSRVTRLGEAFAGRVTASLPPALATCCRQLPRRRKLPMMTNHEAILNHAYRPIYNA